MPTVRPPSPRSTRQHRSRWPARRGLGLFASLVVLTVVAQMLAAPASAQPPAEPSGTIEPALAATLDAEGSAEFMIYFADRADTSFARNIDDWTERGEAVMATRQRVAEKSQASVRAELEAAGVEYQPYWIVNAVHVTRGSAALANRIAADPEVRQLDVPQTYELPEPVPGVEEAAVNAVEWGIAAIRADQAWGDFGFTGEDVVVANIDTGAQFDHPALVRQYRGNLGDGTFDHNYNWFDPSQVCGTPSLVPCDNDGHGSHTMGTMVGDDGAGNQIGVAPSATWIAAKGCESNSCSGNALLASGQWIVAPTDLNNENPDPSRRPHVVNNSWGGGGGDPWYEETVIAWIDAGIFPAFANGNNGPGCGSAGSPGDYEESYGVGAFDINGAIAGFSSRGPGENGGIKPNLAAPGVNVRSSVPGDGYDSFNGTSMATPHLAGAVALMWSAAPALVGDVDETRELLDTTAVDTEDLTCGGEPSNNNVWGEGKLDAYAAVEAAPRGPIGTLTGTVTDNDTGDPVLGAVVEVTGEVTRERTTGADGTYSVVLPVGDYTVTVAAFGYEDAGASVTVTEDETTTQDFGLTPKPTVEVSGTVTDGSGHGWPLYTRIEVAGRPGGPLWTNPVDGRYGVDLPVDGTYAVTFTTTLPGYQAAEETITVETSDLSHDVELAVDLAACRAPGYQQVGGSLENFDGGVLPDGWTVVNNTGGAPWAFDDPGGRGNLTGGSGGFAIVDADFSGPGADDAELVSPVVDLSGVEEPTIEFNTDFRWYDTAPDEVADIDLSLDGGETWTNVWRQTGTDLRGPRLEAMDIPAAAGQAAVRVRFRYYNSDWDWWWQVDNVTIGQRPMCTLVPGGLVVGTVNDANTGDGLNDATVTSVDEPDDQGTTTATPEDPNVGEGFYWLFSSLTGSHPYTAAKTPYQTATRSVDVAADGVTRADFALNAGLLTISRDSLERTQRLGRSTSARVRITNTGTAPATLELSERVGAFDLLAMQGAPLRRVPSEEPLSPAWLGNQNLGDQNGARGGSGVFAGPAADPSWSTTAPYPVAILDNSAAFLDGQVYSVGGHNGTSVVDNGYVYDPFDDTWTAIADMPVPRERPGVAFVDGRLYVSGGWDAGGATIGRTDVYNPATDTWDTTPAVNPSPRAAPGVGVVDGQIYLVGGCADSFCTPSADVVRYDPPTDTWITLPPYPHNVAWTSCGGIDDKLYCAGGTAGTTPFRDGYVYDPGADSWSPIADLPIDLWGSAAAAADGLLVVSGGGTGGSTVTNQGFAYNPSLNTWSALPNAQYPVYRAAGACGFYKIGGSGAGAVPTPSAAAEALTNLDQCGVTDVPWLTTDRRTATLAPGQSVTVTVALNASPGAGVTQPGTYTAQLGVASNTPYRGQEVNVTMNVTPPPTWGKITGTITGLECNGSTPTLRGAQVQADGRRGYTFSLKTDANGEYGFWAPANSNPFTVIATKDGWIPRVRTLQIKAGETTTANFTLRRLGC